MITEHGARYRDDIIRIKAILISKGYEATLTIAEQLWQRYSDSMCAGWAFMPEDDDDVFDCINEYFN